MTSLVYVSVYSGLVTEKRIRHVTLLLHRWPNIVWFTTYCHVLGALRGADTRSLKKDPGLFFTCLFVQRFLVINVKFNGLRWCCTSLQRRKLRLRTVAPV